MKKTFIKKKYTKLFITAAISMIITYLLQIVDLIIAGNAFGEEGISAINLVTPIYGLLVFLGNLFIFGTNMLFTSAQGEFDKEKMKKLFSQGLIMSIVVGILFFIAIFFAKGLYYEFYHVTGQVLEHLKDYLAYYIFVFAITPLFLYLSQMVYTEGDELICNISYAVSFVGNIVLSLVLCTSIGMQGIALGTLIATILSALTLCIHFFRKTNTLKFQWYLNLKEIIKSVKYAFVDAIYTLSIALVGMIMNRFIIDNYGMNYLVVFSIVVIIIELQSFLDATGRVLTPLINNYRGEKNGIGEKRVLKLGLISSGGAGIIFSLILFIFAKPIVSCFGVTDPAIMNEAILAVRIISSTITFTAIALMFTSYYVIIDKIKRAVIMTGLFTFLIPAILGIACASLFGLVGLWIGFALAPVLVLVVNSISVYFKYGKERFPFIAEKFKNRSYVYDVNLNEESIEEFKNNFEANLIENSVSDKTRFQLLMLCEDLTLFIKEKNKNKKVLLEYSLIVDDNVSLIIRDDGNIFDLTDSDSPVSSLRSWVVSCFMSYHSEKINIVNTGYNRNVFVFSK